MIFKKKKHMNDKATDNKDEILDNSDNLSQAEGVQDESVSNEVPVEIVDEKDKLQAELDEAKDRYLRLQAEFDNFRKRNAKERNELMQTAGKDVVTSLLVVLDDMDRAAKQMEQNADINAVKEGISLVFNKLRSILQQKGLKKMETTNEPFNADLHEAITEIPAPTEAMKGKIIDVTEPGYYLNDKLIRHAKVVVGN